MKFTHWQLPSLRAEIILSLLVMLYASVFLLAENLHGLLQQTKNVEAFWLATEVRTNTALYYAEHGTLPMTAEETQYTLSKSEGKFTKLSNINGYFKVSFQGITDKPDLSLKPSFVLKDNPAANLWLCREPTEIIAVSSHIPPICD